MRGKSYSPAPTLSHHWEAAAGPAGKFRSAGTSGEKAKKTMLATSAGTSRDGDLGEELI